jgi:hypothetical protein
LRPTQQGEILESQDPLVHAGLVFEYFSLLTAEGAMSMQSLVISCSPVKTVMGD